MADIKLYGRIIITGSIRALSGLRIGGSTTNLEIGGVDLPVIRNGVNGEPYIPGSSLKGKMRSLAEKWTHAPMNFQIQDVRIHIAGGQKKDHPNEGEYRRAGQEQYEKYWVNPVFGVPGNVGFAITGPTRLIVRDVPLDPASLEKAPNLDLPYSEVKWENAIDRVTSQANPRQIERVPAGAVFKDMELVFNFYHADDATLFAHVFTALQLVEDDYLGGHGSRGSGKVAFEELTLTPKTGADYRTGEIKKVGPLSKLTDTAKQELVDWARQQIFSNGAD